MVMSTHLFRMVPAFMAPCAWRSPVMPMPSRSAGSDGALAADTALVLTTSGTTAEPRLVPLSHANPLAAADSIRAVLQLTPEDRCLDPMPLAHIHGLSLVLASLLSGTRVHLPGPFAQNDVLELVLDCSRQEAELVHRRCRAGCRPRCAQR